MTGINHDIIISKFDELNNIKGYVPLILHRYLIDRYYDNANEKALQEYYRKRTLLQSVENPSKFLEDDLLKWLKKHKDFEDIING